MANVKISELTSTSDLDGTEQIPVVQGGTTKRVAASVIVADHEADTTNVHGIANTANLATQADITAAINALVTGAPGALDTLNELAAAIGDDANFAATITTALGTKASTDALNTHAADTTSVHGITDTTALLTEVTHDALDHTGLTGVGTEAISAAITTHEAAGDPHAGYVRESLVNAAGDLIVGTADDTVGRLAKGSALQVLRVNAAATALEYADPSGGTEIPYQADAPSSPSSGDVWIDSDATPSGSSVRGNIGYAQVTANQTGIGSSDTDLTSLSVTVTVNSGERIKITAQAAFQQQSSTGIAIFLIKEGATVLNEDLATLAASNYWGAHAEAILTPSAGSHTYKLAAKTSAGTINMEAAATFPAFILVEGIGT